MWNLQIFTSYKNTFCFSFISSHFMICFIRKFWWSFVRADYLFFLLIVVGLQEDSCREFQSIFFHQKSKKYNVSCNPFLTKFTYWSKLKYPFIFFQAFFSIGNDDIRGYLKIRNKFRNKILPNSIILIQKNFFYKNPEHFIESEVFLILFFFWIICMCIDGFELIVTFRFFTDTLFLFNLTLSLFLINRRSRSCFNGMIYLIKSRGVPKQQKETAKKRVRK